MKRVGIVEAFDLPAEIHPEDVARTVARAARGRGLVLTQAVAWRQTGGPWRVRLRGPSMPEVPETATIPTVASWTSAGGYMERKQRA